MKSFIEETLDQIENDTKDLSSLIFILPSQRAGSFLKKAIAERSSKPQILPQVYSIESFIQTISGLELLDSTSILFQLYESYCNLQDTSDTEPFETFQSWGHTLINDFNEIDRYLIDAESLFNYLSEVQDKNHWFLSEERTPFIENYLKFWKQLPFLYRALQKDLLLAGKAYQGLSYREAANKIENYSKANKTTHVFMGFNALNTAEQTIIQHLLQHNLASIYWDLDASFYNDSYHDASLFLRRYFKEWSYFRHKQFSGPPNYASRKNITLAGVPKRIGQAKAIGRILSSLDNDTLKNTAVILSDEQLLLPLLNAIPKDIRDINITMGLPISQVPLASFFELLFQLHLSNTNQFYFRLVLDLLEHPSIQHHLKNSNAITHYIISNNIVNLDLSSLLEHAHKDDYQFINSCFSTKNTNPSKFIIEALRILDNLKNSLQEHQSLLREYLYRFSIVFNKLKQLTETYSHITTLSSLYSLYKDILATETLDFIGKKHQGLQIMGVLESRVLDFEHIIIASVNEGILPSGKSSASYLPYDLKKAYDLPTYKEKDAVYAFHFYHLLQRAKNVTIIYNTEPGDLNSGEKSRFITQLEVEAHNFPNHTYTKELIVPEVPKISKDLKQISKSAAVIDKLKYRAARGFSPSALTTYMRNPLDFYYRYVLGISEADDVEETVAANTLGTVVHDTLEELYQPYLNTILTKAVLASMRTKINITVTHQFEKTYSKYALDKGQNLLIFEVAKRYVSNFLDFEEDRLSSGSEIIIKALEVDNKVLLPNAGLEFPVYLTGKVDRIETHNSIYRIIDYKTGKVESSNLKVKDWEVITQDYDQYSKVFQVLQYAYMMYLNSPFEEHIEAGVISLKNLKSGFLPFSYNKESAITADTLAEFDGQLKALIQEIFDPNIPFIEKEIKQPFNQ